MAISVSASNVRNLDVTSNDPCQPNQVHFALGDAFYNSLASDLGVESKNNASNATALIVWQTKNLCNDTYIYVTADNLKTPMNYTPGSVWIELINQTVDAKHNDDKNTSGTYISYSHTAMLNLEPGYIYNYSILQINGSNSAGPFALRLPALNSNNEQITIGVYSDIDTQNTNSTLDWFNNQAKSNISSLDVQLCLGDLAYDLYSESGKRGEYFFNTAQPSISTWPFMVSPGNHEFYSEYSFLNFRTRMPIYNQTNNQYYSFNLGKVHFVSVNGYFYDDEDEATGQQMLDWIENDLSMADQNRANRPWIIIYSHRPLYCSLNDPADSEEKKCYSMYTNHTKFDEIYHKYKVDLVLQAHVHYWERMMPIYQNKSVEYSSWSQETMTNYIINPSAPIYTIEGSAGNAYFMVAQNETKLADYSVNINTTLGFTIISTVNSSAIRYDHIQASDGSLIDYFYLLKGEDYHPQFSVAPLNNPSSKAWLVALILIFVSVLIGLVVYRRYRSKQVGELEREINQESKTEAPGGFIYAA